jgi:ankyrin repeat protein
MRFICGLLIFSIGSLQAEVNAGAEALAKAARAGDLMTAQTLLENGIDPDLHDRYGKTPLYHAVSFNETNAVELLLAHHADPNGSVISRTESEFPATPLQYAAYMGNLRIASMLITAGAHIDTQGPTGRTALQFAVLGTHLDVIRYLLERGADLKIRDADGTSPLDDAVWRGYLDVVAILLANGASLNQGETKTGATPINEAAYQGDTRLVRYFLQFSPDLSIRDTKGYTPIENAARRGKESSALLLLDAEAKLRKTPSSWERTLDAAIKEDEPALVGALLQHGLSANTALPSGLTPVGAAVAAGSTNVARVLLNDGADPNREGGQATTPLEDASLKGFHPIVELLLEHSARINEVNAASGTTALYAAASFGKADVVKLLLERGAEPNLCGRGRKTPYQAAVENGYNEIASAIQQHGGSKSCEPSKPHVE